MQWEKLQNFEEGNRLTIRGFLFQAGDGKWIVSQEPDLKTCCIGAKHKLHSQMILDGDFSSYSTNIPLKVKGLFYKSVDHHYCLSDVEVTQKMSFPVWTLSAVVIFIFVFLKLKRLLLP